ncbi:MAG: GNAT family N-acetyltransferase [Lachnospiraceae bacterium]|nr:GNAT family N-acetyltransferase [Lachnospiraceae bacterium]
MRIETRRLIIRSVEKGDETVFAKMAGDGSLSEIGFDENCSEWIGDWINEALELTEGDDPRKDYIPCTIVMKETAEVIGSVGCTYYEDTGKIGICYFVGADYRKKGYTTEAVNAYVDFFFKHYNENDIIATILASNVSSARTAEKTGFRLLETKMYKDIFDEEERLYHFYEYSRK